MLQGAGVVDADSHVDETDATWEYMTEAESRFKPTSIDPGKAVVPGDRRPHQFWLVDGRLGLRRWRDDERTGTTKATRELFDVKARVRHMDELGVDIQVIYPTYLLAVPTDRPELELALYRSYNRWLADRTAESNGRLRWVVVPPLRSMDEALEELKFGKEHGACGVFKRAFECNGKPVSDPYFFPLYEEAMRLDLPICIHTGGENLSSSAAAGRGDAPFTVRPQIGCFPILAMRGIPEKFPTLRFGVIEAMASWVPHVIADLKAKNAHSGVLKFYAEHPINLQEDFLRANRFYVTCQTSDDVPYLLKFGAEDSLMIGTDYTHDDQSGVIGALRYIERLGVDGAIPMAAAKKILIDNPRKFYGL